MKTIDIYDLILNLIILAFLISIIVLLIKCQKKRKENFSLSNAAPVKCQEGNNWKNERFFRESNFVLPNTKNHRLVATSPVHAHLHALDNRS